MQFDKRKVYNIVIYYLKLCKVNIYTVTFSEDKFSLYLIGENTK